MSTISEAQDKITKAKTKLVIKHPFFSIVALGLLFRNAIEDGYPSIKTMATDGRHVWWDAEFVMKWTLNQIMGVIVHEVLHVVFFHCLRRGVRNPMIWNIACDYAVNLIVIDCGFELPPDRLLDEKYRNWTVDAIYDDLIEQMKDDEESGGDQPGGGNGWGQVMEPRNDDGTAMSDAQKTELTEEIKVKVIQAAEAAKSVGKLPLALESLIKAVGKPTVDWKDYIQSWVSGTNPDDYTWKRPSRKMLGLYNMFAPSVQTNGCGVGVLSIDTSGSVSDRELKAYVKEIVGIIEICNPDKLYIMQHDVRVNRVDVYEAGDVFDSLKITHRGGTNIRPSFKKAMEIDEQVDWMICFTDMGINDYPSLAESPDFPVLWAATGPNNAPFGTYLPIKSSVEAVS